MVNARSVDTAMDDATGVGGIVAGAVVVVTSSAVGLPPVKVISVAALALLLALPNLRAGRFFEGVASSTDS